MIRTTSFLGTPYMTTFKCELFLKLKLNRWKRLREIHRGQYIVIEWFPPFCEILTEQFPDHCF